MQLSNKDSKKEKTVTLVATGLHLDNLIVEVNLSRSSNKLYLKPSSKVNLILTTTSSRNYTSLTMLHNTDEIWAHETSK